MLEEDNEEPEDFAKDTGEPEPGKSTGPHPSEEHGPESLEGPSRLEGGSHSPGLFEVRVMGVPEFRTFPEARSAKRAAE